MDNHSTVNGARSYEPEIVGSFTSFRSLLPVACVVTNLACHDGAPTCPQDRTPPTTVYEAELYEGGGSYYAPQNTIQSYSVNVTARDHNGNELGANALISPTDAEVHKGENVLCVSSSRFNWGIHLDGGVTHEDAVVFSGYALVDMERLSAGAGCGTIEFQDLVFGADSMGYAFRLTAVGDLECPTITAD